MGTKDPNKLSPSDWRDVFETIGQMHKLKWRIRTVCESCDLKLAFKLATAVRAAGADYSLWNQRHPCRRLMGLETPCGGFVRYEARPPRCYHYFRMDAPDPPGRVVANSP